ncbi:MAG TPA: efflux RND transporter periplasmic adaptor subunit [Anaerolineales bacterium]|nr:efflux RND transporter periplasmic adaptor subunit [Anaerolineales bacterium]
MKNTTKTLVMLIIIYSLALTACTNQSAATPQASDSVAASPEGIVAEGKLKPIHAANLSFQARGVVEEINVKIGDAVKQGDVLARLGNSDVAMAQLTTANLELTQAQQAYDQLLRTEGLGRADAWAAYMDAQMVRAEAERAWEALNVNDIEDRIDDADAEVEDRQSDLKDAQEEFDKYKDLDKDNSKRKTAEDALEQVQEDYNDAVRKLEETTRERDAVRAALDSAVSAEAEAKHAYEQTLNGPNQEQLTLLTSRLENAKAQVAAAEDALSTYQIPAPFDGVVAEVAVEVGEQVSAESRAVSVADTSSWMIETTDVTELEVVNLEVGQQVTFMADALPDVTMNGTVVEISQSSFIQGGDVIYTVRIQADEVDPRLKWGMTVEVNFEALEK